MNPQKEPLWVLWVGNQTTQSLQNPLIKEYTLNYNRIPNTI